MNTSSQMAQAALPAERRQLTILFCDLVGSTALGARLDPEDLQDILTAYQNHATTCIHAAGGSIARYQGDGILAYFGYPAASEDDAERAVTAGLELARGMETGSKVPEKLNVRVGIATGVVLVSEPQRSRAADNPPVVGETANLAARLQELAGPATVVICDTTHRLAGALFDYRDLGLQRAKGLTEPIQAWQVVARSNVANRFRALRSPKLPCIGRDTEIGVLLDLWTQARGGRGGCVVVSGEPGIGKSRLVFELAARVRREASTILRYDCSPQHQNSMLYPMLEHLRRAARSKPGDGTAVTLGVLGSFFQDRSEDTNAAIALIADLMALPVDKKALETEGDAQSKRALLFEAVVGNLQRLASRQPVLILVEDAHWIDRTSRELTELFVGRMSQWPILLVVTCRPEFEPAWRGERHAAKIELKPIKSIDAERLVACVHGADNISADVIRDIAVRADGVPLYIEELTKAVVESGAGRAGERISHRMPIIPSSLHASLTARLDRLGKTREVARIASALGREFTFDLLLAVMPQYSAGDLQEALQRLVKAELLQPSGSKGHAFTFRHALIQDAAYGMLPRDDRKALHERIAVALEEGRFSDSVATQPEIVADHFTKAGLAEPAIRYWTEAGNRSVRGSSLVDAAKHFSEAIRLVQTLPPSASRDQAELKLLLALGPVIMAIEGYAAPATLRVFTRAHALAGPASTPTEQLEILAGLFNVHYGRAELAQAQIIAQQHLQLAQHNHASEARGHCFMGQTYSAQGAFELARVHFEQTLAIFAEEAEDTRSLAVYGSQFVVASAFLSGIYTALGDPAKAAASTARSIEYAYQSGHLVSIALALITRVLTPIPGGLKGDPAEAEEALQFCARHGLNNLEVWARFAQGAIMARRGNFRGGVDVMQAAIAALDRLGSELFRPVQLATLASVYARLKEPDRALVLLDEAIATAQRTGERRADAALHRLRGEILIAVRKTSEGKQDLLRSLDIAKTQQAKSEEQRTAQAIAKLVQ